MGIIKNLGKFFLLGSYQAVILYRLAHFLYKYNFRILSQIVTRISIILNNIEISPMAELSKTVVISHGIGIVIGAGVKIGENVLIRQNVTIGQKGNLGYEHNMYPTISNNVKIGAGAVIVGDIVVGNNVIIGANSVVNKDVPDNCVVAGIPFRIIKTVE